MVGNLHAQTIKFELEKFITKNFNKANGTEFRLEINDVSEKILKQFGTDIYNSDTLYIIRGLDIQNRSAYGRIWNNKFCFHYTDQKKWNKGKIIGPNAFVSNLNKKNVTDNFDNLIPLVENGEYKKLKKYSEKHAVISGVWWFLIRIYKSKNKYKTESCVLQDFYEIKKPAANTGS